MTLYYNFKDFHTLYFFNYTGIKSEVDRYPLITSNNIKEDLMQSTHILSKFIKTIYNLTAPLLLLRINARQGEIIQIDNSLHRHFHKELRHRLKVTDKEFILQITSIVHNALSLVDINYYFEPRYALDIKFSTTRTGSSNSTTIILTFRRGSVRLLKCGSAIPEWINQIQLENLEGMSQKDMSDFRISYQRLVRGYGGKMSK